MPFCAYGKIYYDPRETSYGYMEELAFAMRGRPMTRASASTSSRTFRRTPNVAANCSESNGGSAFELTDSPLDESAAYLFRPNGSREELPAYKVVRNEDFAYRMARVQTLLSKFLLLQSVDHIVLYVNPAYGVREQQCAIKADTFSKTVVDFYGRSGVGTPSLVLTITA